MTTLLKWLVVLVAPYPYLHPHTPSPFFFPVVVWSFHSSSTLLVPTILPSILFVLPRETYHSCQALTLYLPSVVIQIVWYQWLNSSHPHTVEYISYLSLINLSRFTQDILSGSIPLPVRIINCWVIFHCVSVPYLLYQFICLQASKLFPLFGCCE